MNIPYTGVVQEHRTKTVLHLAQELADQFDVKLRDMASMIAAESDGEGSSLQTYTQHLLDPAGRASEPISIANSTTNVRGIAQVTEQTMRRNLALLGIDYNTQVGSRNRADDYWQLLVLAMMLDEHAQRFQAYQDTDALIAAYYNGGSIVDRAVQAVAATGRTVTRALVSHELRTNTDIRNGVKDPKIQEIINHANRFTSLQRDTTIN